MTLIDIPCKILAGAFCMLASILGLIGLLCFKLGKDFVELAIKISPDEREID